MTKLIKKCGQPTENLAWYEIGGEEFYQDRLSSGQILAITPHLDGLSFDDDFNSSKILRELGEKVADVLEIILIPKGVPQAEHSEDLFTPGKIERGKWLLARLHIHDLVGMVDDFFVCNLDSSLINRGMQVLQKIQEQSKGHETQGSNGSGPVPSSQEESPLIVPQSLDSSRTS